MQNTQLPTAAPAGADDDTTSSAPIAALERAYQLLRHAVSIKGVVRDYEEALLAVERAQTLWQGQKLTEAGVPRMKKLECEIGKLIKSSPYRFSSQ
jgi:hypothetical protein